MHDFMHNDEAVELGDLEGSGKGKLLISTAKVGSMKKNKVVPIMEAPSNESECSSIKPSAPVTHANSVRSSDRDSFGFIPRKEAPMRKV